jgi:hypothetical protein
MAAINSPHLQFHKYPRVAAGQIAHLADLAVVPALLDATAASACCFFERRLSVITRAFGSPKMPRTVGSARKPGKEYVSQSRRRRFNACAIHHSCQIPNPAKMQNTLAIHSFVSRPAPKITHSIPRRPFLLHREVVWVIVDQIRTAVFCCCCRCGHVGNALALSIMSTTNLDARAVEF